MSKSLSVDLRRRVVDAIENGLSCRQAAERFGVSASSAIRWFGRLKEQGSIVPEKQGGDRKSGRIEAEADFILGEVAERSDITLAELQEKLAVRVADLARVRCGVSSIAAASPLKKTAHAAEQQRWDVKAARQAWFEGQLDLDPEKLIFIDETAASTKMARFYGRAAKGERCVAAIPRPSSRPSPRNLLRPPL
jgi:transposase-like protein